MGEIIAALRDRPKGSGGKWEPSKEMTDLS